LLRHTALANTVFIGADSFRIVTPASAGHASIIILVGADHTNSVTLVTTTPQRWNQAANDALNQRAVELITAIDTVIIGRCI